jgi:hypothetical protein
MRNFFLAVTRNPLSLAGSAVTTASAILILTLFALELVGFRGGPYLGILAFLVLPAIFVLGLLLIPVGIWLEKRKQARAAALGEPPPTFPVIDLNQGRTRRLVLAFLAATMVNVIILALATYKGVEVMDSNEFCGQACHSVMDPEFTTYQRSPHARVKCVSCHIGPGADWFVKSKLSGAWQVVAVTFDLYPRPIPTPVENLRPARETCEQCHWPTKFIGDKLRVIHHYAEDETNSESQSVLLMRVGGIQGRTSHGIHWHVDPEIEIRYRADRQRETIFEVEMTLPDGEVKRYFNESTQPAEGELTESWRIMDCVDCHNRPTHIYKLPKEELDLAFYEGRLDRSLPYLRREGRVALQTTYASHAEAAQGIREHIREFYSSAYPELAASRSADLEAAAAELVGIYQTNVFPSMAITWGTYPNHIGHETAPGCFRCHGGDHMTADGEMISLDCSTCHTLLAMEEPNPPILQQLNP